MNIIVCFKIGCKGTTFFSIVRIFSLKKPLSTCYAIFCNLYIAIELNATKSVIYEKIMFSVVTLLYTY